MLGGAVAVLMLGALASSLKLTFGSSQKSTQPLLPTSQDSTSSLDFSGQPLQPWWSADTVFLVTEAPNPQDPASASPVLIRTIHGEVLAVFEVWLSSPHFVPRTRCNH